MADTSARTLQLLGLLQHHRFWTGDDLSDRLGISARTLRRDIERLRTLGYPVHSSPGVDGGYQLEAGAAMPPLLLDNEEATALVVGLQSAAHGPVTGIADAALRALGKVMQTLPASLRRDVDAVRSMTLTSPISTPPTAVASHTLATVAQACHDEVRLRFAYTARDGNASERTVEPHRIVTLRQRFYLVAYDMDRHDWRTFRLDRITAPDPARNRFTQRPLPADDIVDYVRNQIEQLTATHHVSVLVGAEAGAIRARVGRWAHIEPTAADACRLTMTTDSLDWAAFTLATLDVAFAIEEPDALRSHLRTWAERLTIGHSRTIPTSE